VPQADLLTTSQIAQFKRDGFIVLPGVVDADLCLQARNQMWDTIAEYRPSMKLDDPSTWLPFTEQEQASYTRPADGGDPYFAGSGRGFTIRNGAEDLLLDIGARSVWNIAEQLLGKGEVVWPAGLDASGHTTGPCLMTDDTGGRAWLGGMSVDRGSASGDWTEAIGKTEKLRLSKTGPHWMTAQGTRGMFCTLPNGKPPTGHYPHAVAQPEGPYARAHCGEGLYESRSKLQTVVYFGDVPLGAGGTHVWPGSHQRIWDTWQSIYRGDTLIDINCLSLRNTKHRPDGYVAPPVPDIKADTEPVDFHGPAGSVLLWHTIGLHMAGVNTSTDVIRQATLYAFAKSPESISDERAMANPTWDIWDDWSDEVRAVTD
jgi:hypothetical protein